MYFGGGGSKFDVFMAKKHQFQSDDGAGLNTVPGLKSLLHVTTDMHISSIVHETRL